MGFFQSLGQDLSSLAPILGPIGGVASTAIDAITQQHANQTNVNQANTVYQRGVADMKAAGLNPAMAYGGQTDPVSQVQPITQNTPSKFATAVDTYNTIATGSANRDLIRQQSNAAAAKAQLDSLQGDVINPQASLGTNLDYRNAFTQAAIAGKQQELQSAQNYPAQFTAQLKNTNANTASAQAQASYQRSLETLNDQQMTNQWFRNNIQPFVNSTAATLKPFIPFF